MKRIVSLVLILHASALIIGCSLSTPQTNGKLNGLHRYFYPDGSLYLEVNYKDSIPHGFSRQYFKNGKLFEETEYVSGRIHGISKKFHENGQLSSETPYDSGRMHGVKKKYRQDGKLAYEAPYHYDKPCTGLVEYYLSGNTVKNYPTIVIKSYDRLLTQNQYVLEISMSDDTKRVEFYKGELTDGKYIGARAEVIHTVNGVGRLYYVLPSGAFVMEKLNIIAKAKTDLNNYYITETRYNLAVENR